MLNKIILIGYAGKDPEVRDLENGSSVASFSLATSESWKNKSGEWVDHTEWHNIVCWRGAAKYAGNNIKKGDLIHVVGKVTNRAWIDKEGNKRYITEVVVNELKKLNKTEKSNNSAPAPVEMGSSTPTDDDDLPF